MTTEERMELRDIARKAQESGLIVAASRARRPYNKERIPNNRTRFNCGKCHISVERRSPNQKYCPSCSAIVTRQKSADWKVAQKLTKSTTYALYCFEHYYPKGGVDDLVFIGTKQQCRDNVGLWKQTASTNIVSGWGFQIVHIRTMKIVEEGGEG